MVAKWLLPHFARRPLTMQRFPDGVRGKVFYEKEARKYTPPWVHTLIKVLSGFHKKECSWHEKLRT